MINVQIRFHNIIPTDEALICLSNDILLCQEILNKETMILVFSILTQKARMNNLNRTLCNALCIP